MKEITYKGRKIIPIMKPMLVWDDDESEATEAFVYVKEESDTADFLWRGWRWDGWKHAKPLESDKPRTIKDGLEEGDVITNTRYTKKVLGICGEVIFVSHNNNHSIASTLQHTLKELVEQGYELLQKESNSIKEMTVAEISEKLGYDVKVVK